MLPSRLSDCGSTNSTTASLPLEPWLVEIAPLKVAAGVEVLLEDRGTPVMAMAHVGKGEVFALGDPWIYNEYIGHKDNRGVAANLFRQLLQ